MLNDEQIKGKWKEIKGGIRNVWGQLSDDDLERTKGNFGKIAGLVQERYGETKETIREKFDRLMASFDNETDKHPLDVGSSSYKRKPMDDYDSSEIYDDNQNLRS